ncbi:MULTISPECIES: LacI family DNA-binding transcriptional regulator [unclassified Nocardioides]|uniref:LacI family DNA-binding transcriptional regulator n=1 Tax=unclassified Nocardioides TaxID=2615069 RepID=UPI001150B7D3|nr:MULTISPECIES: LacI family DNA-binding transcriptional regulator [unclassified Nocardioides]TQK68869.1 LacI family transcriptional regulator [Nocardioides sp. SLBN-35]WGY01874.1 LacI family DNA-binding transcriptional regulator [Nocardioides sp. QY071]
MADVAREAGVSVATVSRALSGTRAVDPALAERVLAAAERLGYQVNLVGRALRQTRTATVGLVVPDLDNPFFSALAQHLARVFTETDVDLFVFAADGSLATELRGVRSFLGRQVDALVMIPVHEVDSADAVELAARAVPTVQLDRCVPSTAAHFVAVNNLRGMELVGEHAAARIDLARQPVVYVGAEPDSSSAHERLDGFRQAFGPDAPVLLGSFSSAWGNEAARRLLADGWERATVVTAADVIALGVLSQLLHAGRAVPDDFRVIGFDGIGAGTLAHPPLTTVRQPVEEMTLAIRDLIDGGEGPERDAPTHGHRFAPVFIEGETSP